MMRGSVLHRISMVSFIILIIIVIILSVSSFAGPFRQAWGQAATFGLTVTTQNAQGTTITGYWTTLSQNGAVIATGFSPVTFTLNSGQQYVVSVSNYAGVNFHHWLDTGSTSVLRTVSIIQATTITAVYGAPVITLNPTSGPSSTTVTGTGFSSNSPVTIVYDGTPVVTNPSSVTTSSAGGFTASFTLPGTSTLGPHTVEATDGNALSDTATFTHDDTADTTPPIITASPAGGTYYFEQSVTLSSNETPTTIYYTIDGSDPTSSPSRILYTAPITISTTTTLTYYGIDAENNPSVPQTQNYQLLPPTQVVLNVNTADLSGSPVKDIYVTIAEGNSFLFAGNTPVSYSVTTGTTYTVGTSIEEILQDASYTFDHWDDGSTSRTRTITPTQTTTLTAYYRVNTAGWATITVNAADLSSGGPLSGIYVTISPAIRNIASGYTPLAYTLASDTAYTFTPQDYGSYVFDHWEDGDTTRARTITPTVPANLIAHFMTLPSLPGDDTIAPLVAISSPTAGQILASSSPTISGTASDNVGVTKVEVSVDGGEYKRAGGLTSWSFAMMGLSDGQHSATVRVSDAAGNTQTATINFGVTASPIIPKTGVYAPLYVDPSPSNMFHYNTVINAKLAHPSVPIVITINPAGGPGSSMDSNYANAINSLQSAGVVVVGYVPTKYGSRDINAVKSDIDKYVSWYNIDGIHIDEVSNDPGYENYYTEVTVYGKSQGLRFIMGNAGTDVPQSYIGTMDSIGITEGPGYVPGAWLQYCILCTTSGWHYNYDKNNFWIQRYNVETLDTQYVLEASKWVGLVYLTDGVSPVRWDHLPPYFDTLVATLDLP